MENKRSFDIKVFFDKGCIVSQDIQLVANDYNSVVLNFIFDREDGRKVFELKKPDDTIWIKDIEDNRIILVDYNEEGNCVPLIDRDGKYTYEVVLYDEEAKLTTARFGEFRARAEIVDVNNDVVAGSPKLPILDDLIKQTDNAIINANSSADYAKEQGNYAKQQASNVISANATASGIINNFEKNVSSYTSAFNKNAEDKTTDFNTNATNKVKEYNDNATNSVKSFNDNAEKQTNTFNENATERLNAYNTNAENKFNEFNTNADSYNERITINENNIVDINGSLDVIVPKNDASGVPIYVDDAVEYKVLNLVASGNYKQETTTGQQLYDVYDVFDFENIVIVDEDGWITVSYDNTNGTSTKWFDFKTNMSDKIIASKTYTLAIEIKSISGDGAINFVSAQDICQFINSITSNFNNLSVGTLVKKITAKADFSEVANFLNSYGNFSAGQSGSITFRLSVLEDTSVTADTFVYEPFTNGASPNPEYPQEIEVLEGYNLFDKNELIQGNLNVSTGDEISSEYAIRTPYINVNSSSMYTISGLYAGAGNFNIKVCQFADDDTFIEGQQHSNSLFPNFTTSKNTSKIRLAVYSDSKTTPMNFDELFPKFQLVKGTQKTYLPYKNIGYRSVGKNKLNVPSEYTLTGSETHNINIPAGSYIISWEDIITTGTEKNMLMYFYYEDGTTLTRYISSTYASKTLNLTATKNINKVNIYSQSGYNTSQNVTTTFKNLMISTEGGEYEPYKEPIIVPIDFKGNFVGKLPNGVADNLLYKDRHIYLEKNIAYFEVEERNLGSLNTAWYTLVDYIELKKPSGYMGTGNTIVATSKNNILMDKFYSNVNNPIRETFNEVYSFVSQQGNYAMALVLPKGTTLEEAKELAIGTKVYYQLKTPELIDLGEYDLSTFEGTNNISLLANLEPSEMNITYALDLKKYTDKKIAELSSQIL